MILVSVLLLLFGVWCSLCVGLFINLVNLKVVVYFVSVFFVLVGLVVMVVMCW